MHLIIIIAGAGLSFCLIARVAIRSQRAKAQPEFESAADALRYLARLEKRRRKPARTRCATIESPEVRRGVDITSGALSPSIGRKQGKS